MRIIFWIPYFYGKVRNIGNPVVRYFHNLKYCQRVLWNYYKIHPKNFYNILRDNLTNNSSYIKFTQYFLRIFQKFHQIFRKHSLKFWQVCFKIFYKFFQKYLRFSINKYYCQNFCFFYRCFTYCSKSWLTIFCNFFFLFLLYFNAKSFVYFIQNLNHPYKKFTFIFYKLKNFPHVFIEFCWISPISLKFPEIFPTIYSKLSRIFSQNFHS